MPQSGRIVMGSSREPASHLLDIWCFKVIRDSCTEPTSLILAAKRMTKSVD